MSGMVGSSGQEGTKIWDFASGAVINSAPAIGADGTIYFGSLDGKVYALNPNGGKRWEFATQAGITSSPAVDADGNIYIGSLDARLYCLDPRGTIRWVFQSGGQVNSSPALAPDGIIYFGSMDQNLYALEHSGAKKWQLATDGGIFSSPAVAEDGTIYVGSRDNKLHAVNPDGTRKWEYETGSWIDSSPAIGIGGRIYVGSRDAKIYAFEKSGRKAWEFAVGGSVYSSPAVGPDGTIYVGSLDGNIRALTADGALRWSSLTANRIVYSSPAIGADGTVYVGSQDNGLYAFGSDGVRKWRFDSPGSFDSSPVTLGREGTLYVGCNDGKLYAVKAGTALNAGPWPMFRRDTRHTASGFVVRILPPSYAAGAKMLVSLNCTPAMQSAFYAVEDTAPPNWQIGAISDGGVFDATARAVKFGPFLDGAPRLLTYEVMPSVNETGLKQFVGSSFLDNGDALVGGDQMVPSLSLHPADNSQVDGWMTIGEVTAYGAAWKAGTMWPASPNPIPLSYLNRALSLWKGGEIYNLSTNFTSAPSGWVNVTPDRAIPHLAHMVGPVPDSIANGEAESDLPNTYRPSVVLTVTIAVNPTPNVMVYAAEDQPPVGWSASQISAGGVWDAAQQKIKWGPFFDHDGRTLSYQVTPPPDASGDAEFHGVASFDGGTVLIRGRRHIPSHADQAGFVERRLPAGYSPAAPLMVTLEARPPLGVTFYAVEERPPASWEVNTVSNNGWFDSANRAVRFGPFFDDSPRALTYVAVPPPEASVEADFTGITSTEQSDLPIGGDQILKLVPLHPADNAAADSWLSIGEVTAYGAAWKRGVSWPLAPNSIPPSYLQRAIGLWKGGEEYRFDSNSGSPPASWTNLGLGEFSTNKFPRADVPPVNSTDTSASATVAQGFQSGVALTITIAVVPPNDAVSYAVEDIPPSNWAVSQVSDQGFYDPHRKKVKWGPFFDAVTRTLTYQVMPPQNSDMTAAFVGVAAFDGTTEQIGGQRLSSRTDFTNDPTLTFPRVLDNGVVDLTVSGLREREYLIEASTNLNHWVPITMKLSASTNFTDVQATNFAHRFYRIAQP